MEIKAKQVVGRKTRTVDLSQRDGVNFDIITESGHTISTDEALENGGGNAAPRPLETITAALAACQTVQVVRVADAMRFNYTGLSVQCGTTTDRISGMDGNDKVMRFADATLDISFRSDEPENRIARLKVLAVDRCPIGQLFADAGAEPRINWNISPLDD